MFVFIFFFKQKTAYEVRISAWSSDVCSSDLHRTDLYAIGVLAWEMLTGKLPYEAGDAVSMAIMHVKDPIPRLPPSLRHWQRFIDRALAKGPIKRFHDAAHMLSALERVPQRSGTHEMLALPALREQIAQ